MSEILKVLNKKVELKSEVVEFNKIEDIQKAAAKIGGGIMSKESDILALASKIKTDANKYNSFIADLKKASSQAKDLGVDKLVKEANESIKHYENKIKRADKMLVAVKSAIKR